jgi:protein TonB
VRVSPGVQASAIISQRRPTYPPLARAARLQGKVVFAVNIGPDGAPLTITPISGEPLLVDAALEAVQQWRWRPTLLNGQAVPTITDVEVNFTLN